MATDEDGAFHFVEVTIRSGRGAELPDEEYDACRRRRMESAAMNFLAESDIDADAPVHFDAIGICTIDGNRALMRHIRNVIG